MSFLLLILVIIFSILLIKSADLTVISLRKLINRSSIVGFSAVIIAIGTSFPELFMGVTSSASGKSGLSLGVPLGSNIANIALIGAGAALITGRVYISDAVVKKIAGISFVCGILPYILLFDGKLTRIDGFILLLVYGAYTISFFRGFGEQAVKEYEMGLSFTKFIRKIRHISEDKWKSLANVFIGISLMLFSADTIVKFSSVLGERSNIPIFIIGLFILAVGTSLPEFAFSLQSLKDKESSMFIGNLMGSIVANTTLVIGLSAVINPINSLSGRSYLIPAVAFVAVFLLFYLFVHSKRRLDRWEAGVLLGIYFLFFVIEMY